MPASFIIDGMELNTMGYVRGISNTLGFQLIVAPYALMLRGLAVRINEQWAPGVATLPVNSWTLVTSITNTAWSGFTPTSTAWTLAAQSVSTTWVGITAPSTTWTAI